MELKRDSREGFKTLMNEWLREIRNKDIDSIKTDVQTKWNELGITFIGMEVFGETLTFGGEWISEGVAIEVNINPKGEDNEFRVLYRWR